MTTVSSVLCTELHPLVIEFESNEDGVTPIRKTCLEQTESACPKLDNIGQTQKRPKPTKSLKTDANTLDKLETTSELQSQLSIKSATSFQKKPESVTRTKKPKRKQNRLLKLKSEFYVKQPKENLRKAKSTSALKRIFSTHSLGRLTKKVSFKSFGPTFSFFKRSPKIDNKNEDIITIHDESEISFDLAENEIPAKSSSQSALQKTKSEYMLKKPTLREQQQQQGLKRTKTVKFMPQRKDSSVERKSDVEKSDTSLAALLETSEVLNLEKLTFLGKQEEETESESESKDEDKTTNTGLNSNKVIDFESQNFGTVIEEENEDVKKVAEGKREEEAKVELEQISPKFDRESVNVDNERNIEMSSRSYPTKAPKEEDLFYTQSDLERSQPNNNTIQPFKSKPKMAADENHGIFGNESQRKKNRFEKTTTLSATDVRKVEKALEELDQMARNKHVFYDTKFVEDFRYNFTQLKALLEAWTKTVIQNKNAKFAFKISVEELEKFEAEGIREDFVGLTVCRTKDEIELYQQKLENRKQEKEYLEYLREHDYYFETNNYDKIHMDLRKTDFCLFNETETQTIHISEKWKKTNWMNNGGVPDGYENRFEAHVPNKNYDPAKDPRQFIRQRRSSEQVQQLEDFESAIELELMPNLGFNKKKLSENCVESVEFSLPNFFENNRVYKTGKPFSICRLAYEALVVAIKVKLKDNYYPNEFVFTKRVKTTGFYRHGIVKLVVTDKSLLKKKQDNSLNSANATHNETNNDSTFQTGFDSWTNIFSTIYANAKTLFNDNFRTPISKTAVPTEVEFSDDELSCKKEIILKFSSVRKTFDELIQRHIPFFVEMQKKDKALEERLCKERDVGKSLVTSLRLINPFIESLRKKDDTLAFGSIMTILFSAGRKYLKVEALQRCYSSGRRRLKYIILDKETLSSGFETLFIKGLKHAKEEKNGNVPEDISNAGFALSKFFEKDEKKEIDYFVSHSWSDNGEEKLEKLKKISEEFEKVHKRLPKFWIDYFCISQQPKELLKAVKFLPFFLMACKKVLALKSDLFTTRLWCLSEIYTRTIMSAKDAQVSDFIEVIPLSSTENVDKSESVEKENWIKLDAAGCFKEEDKDLLMNNLQYVPGGKERVETVVNKALKEAKIIQL